MFVCLDKSCDLAERTLCLLGVEERGRVCVCWRMEVGGHEEEIEKEKEKQRGVRKSRCVAKPALSCPLVLFFLPLTHE